MLAIVGSPNPLKLSAARSVFSRVYPECRVSSVSVDSGIPAQPWGDAETRAGAVHRARAALASDPSATLGVGFEGGVVEEADGSVRTCAWAAVATRDGAVHLGGSLALPLPAAVAARLRAGEELGHAVDALLGVSGTKHGGGAVAVLTRGLVDRQRAYEHLLAYALAPLLGPAEWGAPPGAA